ncbi:MAG: HEAT repeat domain-containing protein, partial [Deltaproteobacteria bacterium]|nr:HEAT repeat domain-containing protein [Deltaproteobacteria bacterium]
MRGTSTSKLRGLLATILLLSACRDPVPRSGVPGPEPMPQEPDPCTVGALLLDPRGGPGTLPEARAREVLEEALLALAVPRDPGSASGTLRVAWLLTPLEEGGWSFGARGLWEIMDGPLRQPLEASTTRELPAGADPAEVAAGELQALAGSLVLRCRMGTSDPESLPPLLEALHREEDRIAWARACGDRRVAACGPGLLRLLESGVAGEAASAAVALGQAGCEDAVPALVRRTERAEPLVVRGVALALGELRTREALRVLALWRDGHPDNEVRAMARDLLGASVPD